MSRLNKWVLPVILSATTLVTLHYLLSLTNPQYGRLIEYVASPSLDDKLEPSPSVSLLDEQPEPSPQNGTTEVQAEIRRANAVIVMLARNSDLGGALKSIRALEDRFNSRYGYPYVLLNDVEFEEEFKQRVQVLTPSLVEFGLIPREIWEQPEWIDEEKASEAREKLAQAGVKYGDSEAYRNMCRFNTGFFFDHPLIQKYKWYWRVEPNVQFHCDILQDPFLFMEDNDKTYGFTLAVYEIPRTIPSLWSHVTKFLRENPTHTVPDNSLAFISNTRGRTYNRCHFWSNFEIASLEFWRSPVYRQFFDYLDRSGGFYYERWGDAPIHTIAVSLFLPTSKIHFFEEIGYQHDNWSHCPQDEDVWRKGRCACSRQNSFDYDVNDSCLPQWERSVGKR